MQKLHNKTIHGQSKDSGSGSATKKPQNKRRFVFLKKKKNLVLKNVARRPLASIDNKRSFVDRKRSEIERLSVLNETKEKVEEAKKMFENKENKRTTKETEQRAIEETLEDKENNVSVEDKSYSPNTMKRRALQPLTPKKSPKNKSETLESELKKIGENRRKAFPQSAKKQKTTKPFSAEVRIGEDLRLKSLQSEDPKEVKSDPLLSSDKLSLASDSDQTSENLSSAKSSGHKNSRPLSYGDIVRRGKRFYSKNFELHSENLPSSTSSMKEQLKRLKSKNFPFSFHPEKIPSSPKMSQDIQKRSFGDMFLFKEGEKAILAHLKKVEMARRPKQNFMAAQQDVTVKMRLVLLDWLSEVSSSFRLGTDCLFLAAELIDLFLSKRKVTRSRFQLLGCAALFIAAKFSEIAPPVARDFVYVADSAFSHKDLYEMEILVLKNTEWSLSLPSHSVFCNHFFGVAKTNEKQRHFCWFLLELSIFETELSSTAPSTIISAALFAALHLRDQCRQESIKQSKIWRKFLANGNVGVKEKRCFEENKFLYKRFGRVSKEIAIFWNEQLCKATEHKAEDLCETVLILKKILNQKNPREHSVHRKYSDEKFSKVALSAVAVANKIVL